LFLNGEKFISVAAGVEAGVGHDLESYTSEIGIIKMSFLGCNIVFVDTPGFDDTKRSDSDTLKMISDWLMTTYVVPEYTVNAADQQTNLGLRERSCLAVSFISIGYQTIVWLGILSRTYACSRNFAAKMPSRMSSSPPLCGTKWTKEPEPPEKGN
jgi:hypothetical protein